MPNIECISVTEATQLLQKQVRTQNFEVILTSPLDVCFSQNVVYPKFTDGKSVDDAVKKIRAAEGNDDDLDEEALEEPESSTEPADNILILEPPFPAIEVIRWRPKLRDGDGRPVVEGDGVRYGEEAMFSVDNRRLYALQRAAVARWPRRCLVAVHLVTDRFEVLKHVKKFRTRTNGLSITITEWNGVGRDNAKNFSAMRVWDWRSAVAQAEQGDEEALASVAAVADSGSCGCWEYLDNSGTLRGPFSNWQMRQWWDQKMLPETLRIRPYDAAATASHDQAAEAARQFRSIVETFVDAPCVFSPGWTPRATDADAEWKKCAQCGRRRWEGWSAHGSWYCNNCWRKWHR